MKAEIKGDELIITIPYAKNPATSKSGKSRIVATSSGFVATTAQVKDQPVKISLNAIIAN